METYIQQLIEDFKKSASRVPDKKEYFTTINAINDKHYDEINCCELYGNGIGRKPLGIIFGIPQEAIPPEDKLSNKQLELLYSEIEKLWNAWHFILDFPEATPMRLRYQMLYDRWNDENVFTAVGDIHYDFCGGCCEGCEILEYCPSGDVGDVNSNK